MRTAPLLSPSGAGLKAPRPSICPSCRPTRRWRTPLRTASTRGQRRSGSSRSPSPRRKSARRSLSRPCSCIRGARLRWGTSRTPPSSCETRSRRLDSYGLHRPPSCTRPPRTSRRTPTSPRSACSRRLGSRGRRASTGASRARAVYHCRREKSMPMPRCTSQRRATFARWTLSHCPRRTSRTCSSEAISRTPRNRT